MPAISFPPDSRQPRQTGSGSKLRERLRRALPGFEAGLRILAEGLPARDGHIDLLGADAEGSLVVVCICRGTEEADAALAFARAISTRSWLAGELPGWLQLVPDFDVGPRTQIRTLLLLPQLPGSLLSAIEGLPAGWLEPVVYRPFTHRGDDFLLLEHAAHTPRPSPVVEGGHPAPTAALDPIAAGTAAAAHAATAAPLPPTDRSRAPDMPAQARPVEDPASTPLPSLRSGIRESDFDRAGQSKRAAARGPGQRPRFDGAGDPNPAADSPREPAR